MAEGLLRNEIHFGIGNSQTAALPSFACPRKFPAVCMILPGLGTGAMTFTSESLKIAFSLLGPDSPDEPSRTENRPTSRMASNDFRPERRSPTMSGGTLE